MSVVNPAPVTNFPDVPFNVFARALAKRGLSLRLNAEGTGLQLTGDPEQINDGHRAYIRHYRDALLESVRGGDLFTYIHSTKGNCMYVNKAGAENREITGAKEASVMPCLPSDLVELGQAATESLQAETLTRAGSDLVHGYPITVKSAVLDDAILFAFDSCAIAPIHADTVVYFETEFRQVCAAMTPAELRAYHQDKRDLLTAWMRMAGFSTVYETEVTYYQDGARKTLPGSQTNAKSIARSAGMGWDSACAVINQLCTGGILRGWTPASHPTVRIVSPESRSRKPYPIMDKSERAARETDIGFSDPYAEQK